MLRHTEEVQPIYGALITHANRSMRAELQWNALQSRTQKCVFIDVIIAWFNR